MSLPRETIGKYRPVFLTLLSNWVLLSLLVLSCGMGSKAHKSDPPISLGELETLCRLPAPCGTQLPCAGRTVSLWGYVDPANIFSKQRFPRTPYEKFKLVDHQRRAIEVWAQADDNREIFERLARRPSDRIIVTGKLIGVKLPVMGACHQSVKVLIHDATQIDF